MSDETAIPPTIVIRCACRHQEPHNLTCQYSPPFTCGGQAKCPICRGEVPVEPIPEPAPVAVDAITIPVVDLEWVIDAQAGRTLP